jgi:hypothetical protein
LKGLGQACNLQFDGEKVRAATREPEAARRGSNSAAEFVEFDFERPLTFAPALDRVDRVFLIARPGDEDPDRVASSLIDEMKRQGVRHVNLSAMGIETRDGIGLRRPELYLGDSGSGFTHLRPNSSNPGGSTIKWLMPRACPVESHACRYLSPSLAIEMPPACPVECHVRCSQPTDPSSNET